MLTLPATGSYRADDRRPRRLFDDIMGGLRSRGVNLRHYALTATPETLRRRLIGRPPGRDETWAMRQIDHCVNALADERYATHVAYRPPDTRRGVELIATDARLELIRPRFSPTRH